MSDTYIYIRKIDREYISKNYENLLAKLHADRRVKTARYNNREVAVTSVAAGLLLEEIVEEKLKLLPDDIHISEGESGKPYICGYEDFNYNLSHSGEYVVMAYGDSPLGIDIERIHKDGMQKKDIAVAKRCFTADEYLYITGDDKKVPDRFCMIWTMKESYLKLTGAGISVPLNSFEIDVFDMSKTSIDCNSEHNNYRYNNCSNNNCSNNNCDDITGITTHLKDKPYQYLSFKYDDYIITLCAKNISDVRLMH